ncbi:hypothetical protein N752_18260 [Desulforamulus aquiferis]|nr:GerAB/ArcD/ProY family transporter [Desulforamulus aquiferis]RYD03692.1 hypothetical protein N752_18260 [Desulforamulus aquiferis]
MNEQAYKITSKQLIFILIGATIGVGILTVTSTAVRESQQDAWISILMGALPLVVGIYSMHLIGSRFPDLTFAEYCEIILGKWPGKLLALVFVVYSLAFAAIVTRLFVNILKIYLFPETPIWALSALILFTSAYLPQRMQGSLVELMN